jgi:phosphoribosylglycinamide formyltransferase 1
MKRVVILTGDELRHRYFRRRLARDARFQVVLAVCEGTERGLSARLANDPSATPLQILHAAARVRAEQDFFGDAEALLPEPAASLHIRKGDVNSPEVIARVMAAEPDLLVCYGTSLVRGPLLEQFAGRFLNVHLGLSPWYRGSGTNIWPLIEGRVHMVGATFMHIDSGIDTGPILHQIRAEVALGDSPHSIGNRLIRKMTDSYADLIAAFDRLTRPQAPQDEGRLFRDRDFDAHACRALYDRFADGLIERALADPGTDWPALVINDALEGQSPG